MDNELNVRLQHAVEHDETIEGVTTQCPSNSSIPKDGEIVFNRDRTNFKVGNGTNQYSQLPNFLPSSSNERLWYSYASVSDTLTNILKYNFGPYYLDIKLYDGIVIDYDSISFDSSESLENYISLTSSEVLGVLSSMYVGQNFTIYIKGARNNTTGTDEFPVTTFIISPFVLHAGDFRLAMYNNTKVYSKSSIEDVIFTGSVWTHEIVCTMTITKLHEDSIWSSFLIK